jgi:hypothetical protein
MSMDVEGARRRAIKSRAVEVDRRRHTRGNDDEEDCALVSKITILGPWVHHCLLAVVLGLTSCEKMAASVESVCSYHNEAIPHSSLDLVCAIQSIDCKADLHHCPTHIG